MVAFMAVGEQLAAPKFRNLPRIPLMVVTIKGGLGFRVQGV